MRLFEIVHKENGKKIYIKHGDYIWHDKKRTLFEVENMDDVFLSLKKSFYNRDAFEFGYLNYFDIVDVDVDVESVIELYAKRDGKRLFKKIKKLSGIELISFMRKCENFKTSIQRAMLNLVFELRAKERLDE